MAANISISGFEIFGELDERPGLTIYAGRQVSLDRLVRVLAVSEGLPVELKQRYADGHRRVAQLNHPNLVREIHVGESAGRPLAVVEDSGAAPLSKEIDEAGPLPWPNSLAFAIDLCSALAELHRQKIAHGDLSPNTVYVGADDHPKLLYTGMAAPAGGPYTAPERQTSPRSLSLAADVYSLGAVIYFAFTGRPPAMGEEGIRNPRDLAFMPEALERLLASMMAEEPKERIPDAREALNALQAIERGEETPQKEPTIPPFAEARSPIKSPRTGRGIPLWAFMVGGIAVAAAVVVIAAVLALRTQKTAAAVQEVIETGAGGDVEGALPDPGRRATEKAGAAETGEAAPPRDTPPDTARPSAAAPAAASDVAAAFLAAEEYARANPGDADGITLQFQAVARMSQDPGWAERCSERVHYYRRQTQDRLAGDIAKDVETAKTLAAEGRIDDAIALLGRYNEASLEPRQIVEIKNAIDSFAQPLRASADAHARELAAALEAQKPDSARAALIRLKAIPLPDVQEKVGLWEQRVVELEERIAGEAEKQRRAAVALLEAQEREFRDDAAALERLGKMEEELGRYVRELEFDKAERLIGDTLVDLGKNRTLGELYLELVKRLRGRLAALKKRFETSSSDGSRITVRKEGVALTGRVTSVSERSAVLALASGPIMEVFFRDLDTSDFQKFSGMDTGVQDALFDRAGMHVLRRERDAAAKVLKETAWRADLKPKAEMLLARAGRALEREMEAAELLIRARRAYYDRDRETLRPLLEKLRMEYSDTRIYLENLER